MTLRKLFGQRVKELRIATGMSQEAFADRCGFARSYMSRIERGGSNASLDAIEVLANALSVERGDYWCLIHLKIVTRNYWFLMQLMARVFIPGWQALAMARLA